MSTPLTSPTPKRKHKPAECPDAPFKRIKLKCDKTNENVLLQLDRVVAIVLKNEGQNKQNDLLNMQLELQKVKDLEMLEPLVCFLPPLPSNEDWLLEHVEAALRCDYISVE